MTTCRKFGKMLYVNVRKGLQICCVDFNWFAHPVLDMQHDIRLALHPTLTAQLDERARSILEASSQVADKYIHHIHSKISASSHTKKQDYGLLGPVINSINYTDA